MNFVDEFIEYKKSLEREFKEQNSKKAFVLPPQPNYYTSGLERGPSGKPLEAGSLVLVLTSGQECPSEPRGERLVKTEPADGCGCFML